MTSTSPTLTITTPIDPATARRALAWERRVYLAAHPVAYPLANLFGRLGPVLRVPSIGYVVSDAVIARSVLSDSENFSKSGPGSAGELISQVMGEYALLNLEGDAHRGLRAALLPALNASAVHELVNEVWEVELDRAVSSLRAGRRVDLARLSAVLTGRTMRRVLGFGGRDDNEAALATYELGEKMVRVVRLQNGPLSPRAVRRARRQYMALTDAIAAAIPRAGADTIVGRLREAGLDEPQVRGVGAALLLTGTGTVSTALPRTVALISDAGLWDAVHDRAARMKAIDECLRIITPSPVMLRSVRTETTIDGHRFREGQRVAILTYMAVRAFDGGHAFCPNRGAPAAVRGLHFGAGVHHCIGYALARAELDRSLERLREAAPLRVVRRARAHRVLIPRYTVLEVESAQ